MFNDQIAMQIAREYDNFLFDLFEKHGYSREQVMKLGREKRITVVVHGLFETFIVDGVSLFCVQHLGGKFDPCCNIVTYEHREIPLPGKEVQSVRNTEH